MKQTQYDYLYVLGAVCTHTGQTVGLLSPYIDTGVMNVFLEQFAHELDPGVHVVLIWDQAGFHCSKRLEGSSERHDRPFATLLAGTQSHREPVALSPLSPLVEPGLR